MTNALSPILCLHSSDNYINELCLAYWSLDPNGKWSSSVARLKTQTGKSLAALRSIVKANSSAYIPYLRCNECAQPIQVSGRADFDLMRRTAKNNVQYRCGNCTNTRTIQPNQSFDTVPDQVSEPSSQEVRPTIDYNQLNYTNAVLLYSLLLAAGEQWNNNTIAPISAQIGTLAPTLDFTIEIYLQLQKERIITPSPPPYHRSFPNIGNSEYLKFLPHEVTWVLPHDEQKLLTSPLMGSLELIIEKFDPVSATALWYAVSEAECERYFGELCDRYRFKREILYTEKVGAAIRYCLDRLSLPQVWNILWCTMRTIAALVQEGTYSHPHVYNMIPTIVMRDIDRRMANNQQIRPWGRLQPHKESVITSVLFDKVFQTGTAAFEEVNGKNSSFYR
ncbi:MAG: hypothetical protein JWQ80_2655 [Massilia sp.]|nr:hypothetical protein [Massilia sp.]